MIYGDVFVIGVQLELVAIYDNVKCGIFNFIIDEELIPGKRINLEFYPIITRLQKGLEYGLKKNMPDVGNIPLEQLDFSEGEPEGLICLGAGELPDVGCVFWLGFDGDEDRFFYSTDFEKTIQEKRYPRGTIEKLIRSLPIDDEIQFCRPDIAKIFK